MTARCWVGRPCDCEPRRLSGPLPSARVCAAPSTDPHSLGWILDGVGLPTMTTSAALKLNLCDYRAASSGAITSPEHVAQLVAALRERCPELRRIVLLEQDSSGTRAGDLFALLGFARLAEELGLELFEPERAAWRHVDTVGSLPIEVPEVVYEVDLFVNVPKMKLHGRTAFTGALKNNFGLLKRKWKVPYHERLCETIVASNLHLPPQLTIMDGSSTLSGRGPAYGVPVRPGVALGSWDPVAVDAAAARMLGVPLALAGHVRMASRAGLGSLSPEVEWAPGRGRLAERPPFDWLRFAAANAFRRS